MQRRTREEEASLEEVEKKYAWWRRHRIKRGPIPSDLMELAVKLVKRHGLGTIVKTLRINQTTLKGKVQEYESSGKGAISASFLEIPVKSPQLNPTPRLGGSAVIEFENPDGYKTRFYTNRDLSKEIEESLKLFYGEER
jgi:hypothetical protein